MILTVYKYPVGRPNESFTAGIPGGSKFLSVQMQAGKPVMWWLVDPGEEVQARKFHVVGTGWPVNQDTHPLGEYLGTYQQGAGAFVWHLFEADR